MAQFPPNQVRTRYAPSPTGSMHVGNLRTALYAYLLARGKGGAFLLRIEDTDQARQVEGALDIIYDSLRVTGLLWDEGPDKGGPVGPYVQSERKPIYREHALALVEKGHAYPCFCTKATLDEIRKSAEEEESAPIAAYDRRCARIPVAEARARMEKEPYVIRQKIKPEGTTKFNDLVYGEIVVNNEQLDDQILLKSDGFPTYNFANVVDDHLMGITHVLRGSEYISSTPKYVQLYEAFGWKQPESIHLPLILGADGKKLSKRQGSVSLGDYLDQGYLPEAVVNYIALLGWSPGDNTEFFTLEELVKRFDVTRINKAAAIFDEQKAKFINSQHIKAKTPQRFHELALPYIPKELHGRFDLKKLTALIQPRTEKLTDIPGMLEVFLRMPSSFDKALYEHKKMKTTPEASLPVLKEVREKLASFEPWTNEALHHWMVDYATQKGLKNGQVMWPVRVALSGLPNTPGGAVELADLLGREETLRRLDISIGLLT